MEKSFNFLFNIKTNFNKGKIVYRYTSKTNKVIFLLVVLISLFSANAFSSEREEKISLNKEDWVVLSYEKIPANEVKFNDNLLKVNIKNSAGPIVHKLSKALKVSQISILDQVIGSKKTETGAFDEDSLLRFGLVAVGKQTLSGPKKWFAADWVKKLFALAPEGTGLDKIYFYNLTNRSELIGKSRLHPKSDLLVENIVSLKGEGEGFELSHTLEKPIETAAVWISIDGDDSKSNFETQINLIKLKIIP